jgi:hypothetical protein
MYSTTPILIAEQGVFFVLQQGNRIYYDTSPGSQHWFLNAWWYKGERCFRSMGFQSQQSKIMGYLIAISINLLDRTIHPHFHCFFDVGHLS